MIGKTIWGLLLVLAGCAGNPQPSGSGLWIENGPTRGLGFTDSLGVKYGIVYITTTIRNDSTLPIQVEIALPKEKSYPIAYGEEQFQILRLPKAWGIDGLEITDSMIHELPTCMDRPFFSKILAAGDSCVETIGILRPVRDGLCSATPYALLEKGERGKFPSCAWEENENQGSPLELGLKVGFCTRGQEFKSCMIIPCGKISYPKQMKAPHGRKQVLKSGLLIDNGINRGVGYTDSLGNAFNLRYIPIAITNDSTIPIELHLDFPRAYAYPADHGDEPFRIIPLPGAWALEGVGVTDSMLEQLKYYIARPSFSQILAPGEKILIAIGTLYPRPPKFTGVLPRALFTAADGSMVPACEQLMDEALSDHLPIALGLKLIFGESCRIIPCGHISFPER